LRITSLWLMSMHATAAPRRSPLLCIEGERLQLLDFFDVNQMPGAADSSAQLDEDVCAAA